MTKFNILNNIFSLNSNKKSPKYPLQTKPTQNQNPKNPPYFSSPSPLLDTDLAGMPRLVQVTAEQAQIPEDDTTKARDPESGDRDPAEVAPKACDPDSGGRNPEEVATKARDLDAGDRDPKEVATKSPSSVCSLPS